MRGLVCKHRLSDDIANRKDVRLTGPLLGIHGNKALIVYGDAGCLGINVMAVR